MKTPALLPHCAVPNYKPFIRPFFIVFGIYIVGIFPIIRANRLYLDDIGRALYGYSDWSTAARPVADLLSFLFFLGPGTLDASPLTQLLAAAFLAVTSVMLCAAFKVPVRWYNLLCTVPIGLSPYGLENISYKFDSAWMALAMLLALLPFLFLYRDKKKFFLTSLVCIFVSASIYQAALGFYISTATFVFIVHVISKRTIKALWRDFLWILLPFSLALGLYAAQAKFWFRNDQYTSYVAMHNTVPSLMRLPFEIATNCTDFAVILWQDWSNSSLGWLLALLISIFTISVCMHLKKNAQRLGGAQTILRTCLLVLLIPYLYLSPLGIQILLQEPVWSPRTFCSFGLVITLMLLHVASRPQHTYLRMLCRAVQICIILQLLIFSQVYGNLLAAQNNWERNRIAALALGLSLYITTTDSTTVTFRGSIGQTPLTVVPIRRYPLLERMVAVPLTRQWRWGYEQLKLFGIYVSPGRDVHPSEALTLFMETPTYKILSTDDGVGVVQFKDF